MENLLLSQKYTYNYSEADMYIDKKSSEIAEIVSENIKIAVSNSKKCEKENETVNMK